MGCTGSKAEDLPLVVRCRERRELIRAAANHRYALAAAHAFYFRSLKDVGDALGKFVDEELIAVSASSSSLSSPSLILPPAWEVEIKNAEVEEEESHLHISDSSSGNDGDSEGDYKHQHHEDRLHDSDDGRHQHHSHSVHVQKGKGVDDGVNHNVEESPSDYFKDGFYGYGYGLMNDPSKYPSYLLRPHPSGEPYLDQLDLKHRYYSSNVHYMKKSVTAMKSVVQGMPSKPAYGYSDSYWNHAANHSGDYGYFTMDPPVKMGYSKGPKVSPRKESPPPPSPPKASIWDFLNMFDGGYKGYYSSAGTYGYWPSSSSPNLSELRESESIPDLEEETEDEVYKEDNLSGMRMNAEARKSSGESESKKPSTPLRCSGESVKPSTPHKFGEECVKPSTNWDIAGSISLTDKTSSPKTLVSRDVDSEVGLRSKGNGGSSKLSSVTTFSPHGTRNLQEVVAEIRDDFEIASGCGKEVAILLEVGKMPYRPGFLKVILSRMLYLIAPSLTFRDSSSEQYVKLASRSIKFGKYYFQDVGRDINANVGSLSSTLDKLYAWEKKLYKEVKDEEQTRIMYEKQCKRLKVLDEVGAESGKIDAAQASVRRLLTRLDVCMRTIDVISNTIHKLMDEELQPKVAALIHGLIRMWKAMLKCHQKQFQAIMDCKTRKLKVNTAPQTDSSLRQATKLEKEVLSWCHHFNNWIDSQKSYVESLNRWLFLCLQYETEETHDVPLRYSPNQLGAPPIFIICNDWHQAMEAISKKKVVSAMNAFAASLQILCETQDKEQHQRLKAESLSKTYDKLLRTHRVKRGTMEREQVAISDKTDIGLSTVQSDTEFFPLDDSLRQRLTEEMIKHKKSMKSVQSAASSTLQRGLIPIFKVMESFTSEALEAYKHVRLQQHHDQN